MLARLNCFFANHFWGYLIVHINKSLVWVFPRLFASHLSYDVFDFVCGLNEFRFCIQAMPWGKKCQFLWPKCDGILVKNKTENAFSPLPARTKASHADMTARLPLQDCIVQTTRLREKCKQTFKQLFTMIPAFLTVFTRIGIFQMSRRRD
jgi:hypothetical protein